LEDALKVDAEEWAKENELIEEWLGRFGESLPANWFRRNRERRLRLAGLRRDSRVLKWVVERLEGRADAVETPIGHVPSPEALDLTGIDVSAEDLEDALKVDAEEWAKENELIEEWLGRFGESLPA
ncbi:phosphoenolpyruvate carboxykinase (GTP), partial [Corynebacterium diphtheriae]